MKETLFFIIFVLGIFACTSQQTHTQIPNQDSLEATSQSKYSLEIPSDSIYHDTFSVASEDLDFTEYIIIKDKQGSSIVSFEMQKERCNDYV